MPLVTVAVPVHNGARTLRKCLESLAAQTCNSFKVIVFENASTDESRAIAESFSKIDNRFEVRPSSTFLSVEQNFSRAISEAAQDSEYFCLRSSDDYATKNFLADLCSALTSHPEAALAVSPFIFLRSDGNEYIRSRHAMARNRQAVAEIQRHFGARYKGVFLPGPWYHGLYRSEHAAAYLLDSFRLFPHPWGVDKLVVYKMIADHGIVFVPGAVFYKEIGSDSRSKYAPKVLSDALRRRYMYYSACMDMDLHRNSLGLIDAIHSRWHAWKVAGHHTGSRATQLLKLAFGLEKKIGHR
jgi:glycosyltransferase involved in cell wall biosynthesis